MKKSDFFNLVKKSSTNKLEISIHEDSASSYSLWLSEIERGDCEGQIKLKSCRSEEKSNELVEVYRRWLSEAIEEIHPSETQWMPEEEKIQPGLHEAKTNAVGVIADKVVYSMHVGGQVISMSNKIHGEEAREVNKTPEKMFVRATINILKRYDCFDSLKNPHWSNLSKKQKKSWARNFGIEMMECWIHACAMDLASDEKYSIASANGTLDSVSDSSYLLSNKEVFLRQARDQLIAELDYSDVENYVEENLNCLW